MVLELECQKAAGKIVTFQFGSCLRDLKVQELLLITFCQMPRTKNVKFVSFKGSNANRAFVNARRTRDKSH